MMAPELHADDLLDKEATRRAVARGEGAARSPRGGVLGVSFRAPGA